MKSYVRFLSKLHSFWVNPTKLCFYSFSNSHSSLPNFFKGLQTQNTSLEKNAFEVFELKMKKSHFLWILTKKIIDSCISDKFKMCTLKKLSIFAIKNLCPRNNIPLELRVNSALQTFKKIKNSVSQHSNHYDPFANF